MNDLNFSNETYKNIALSNKTSNIHLPSEAFFLILNKLKKEDLDNLCKYIHTFLFNNSSDITLDDCYDLTQNMNLDINTKDSILSIAYQCIEDGVYLGTNAINDGKINTSSWISHSLYSAKLSGELARNLSLDENSAKTLALLHDYGRKFTHTFSHTITGFEELVNIGWYSEAIGCLTHSFINCERCANNEPARDGFYVDDNGNPNWKENTKKDDITLFLENHEVTDYDTILNITDLMATARGIVSPYDRIQDIATRRTIDPTNRYYFLAIFTNTLIDYLKTIDKVQELKYIKADKNTNPKEIEEYFKYISNIFYNKYLELNNINYKL